MSDDIVKRPCCDVRPCGCADARMVIDHLHTEIERLRAELNSTQELLARCYQMAVGHGPDFDVFDTWEEAVSAYEDRPSTASEIAQLRAEVARLGTFLHPVGMVINTYGTSPTITESQMQKLKEEPS